MRVPLLFAALLACSAHLADGQQATQFPAVKLAEARDSFFIMVDARAVGTSIYTVAAAETGFVIKESTSMPGMGVQVTEIFTTEAGRPLKVVQTGRMAGQEVGLTLAYANGRATGTARVPGDQTVTVDAAVPENVVDDNMLQALLPLLPWTASSKWEVPIFSGGLNALNTQTLAVTDEVSVSIPAGDFDAYRVELSAPNGVVAFYLAKAAPHRILKIVPGGAPFQFVRAD
jgi:hypothetical protein